MALPLFSPAHLTCPLQLKADQESSGNKYRERKADMDKEGDMWVARGWQLGCWLVWTWVWVRVWHCVTFPAPSACNGRLQRN
jgi:hypothetical protein